MLGVAKIGNEFLVNAQTAGSQYYPKIAGLTNGGYVITWQDGVPGTFTFGSGTLGDSSESSIKAQVFSNQGAKVGGEFLVNTQTAGVQSDPTVTSLTNGGFVITWVGDGIKAQVFGADGTKVGSEFLVNTETAPFHCLPAVASLTDGGFVVSWEDYSSTLGDNSGSSIKAQVFGADGSKVGSEFLVNTQTANNQEVPAITGLKNGGFVVVWEDRSGTLGDASGSSVKAQEFSAGGVKVGSEFLVNTDTPGSQSGPTIAGLANGGFVVTWSGGGIRAQAFSAGGEKVGSEFLVNPQTGGPSAITGLANGGFVVTWTVTPGILSDGSGFSVVAQAFGADGAKVGSKFLVNTQTAVNQVFSTIAGIANDSFVVTWQDSSCTLGDAAGWSIKAQAFGFDEAPVITSNGGGDSAAASIPETSATVGIVRATDADAGTKLSYSISGGADAALFSIDATTGALRFKTAPNFEAPKDASADNVYDVVVQVSDGSLTDMQALAVTVTDVNEAPVITSNGGGDVARVTILENSKAVTTVRATDVDAGTTLTYSISGGADAALFKIDATTGALSFKTAPNFEAPADAGRDNVYDVVVQVSDGALVDTQAIAVTVTNVGGVTIAGTTGNDTITPLAALTGQPKPGGEEDTINGNAGNDTLDGGGGNDALTGGTGIDTFRISAGVDTITDLGNGGADVINVSAGATVNATATVAWTASAATVNQGTANITTNGLAVNLAAVTATTAGNAGYHVTNTGAAATLTGSALDDWLTGGTGNDTLVGGGGADQLRGGLGNDVLTGGTGADWFIFSTAPNATTNVDTLTDFTSGTDKLGLSKATFAGLSGAALGKLGTDAFWSGAGVTSAHDATDRFVYDTTSGKLYYDADGIGGAAAVQIALLGASSHPLLTFSDIQLLV
jgi:Ca2+-binding RTX toxin-like protein